MPPKPSLRSQPSNPSARSLRSNTTPTVGDVEEQPQEQQDEQPTDEVAEPTTPYDDAEDNVEAIVTESIEEISLRQLAEQIKKIDEQASQRHEEYTWQMNKIIRITAGNDQNIKRMNAVQDVARTRQDAIIEDLEVLLNDFKQRRGTNLGNSQRPRVAARPSLGRIDESRDEYLLSLVQAIPQPESAAPAHGQSEMISATVVQ